MTVDTSAAERHVPFASVFNFRDLGGYAGHGGRSLRWRTLYRADGLHRLTGEDVGRFGRLGIRTVIDLRTPGELDERGKFAASEAAYHHLPILDAVWDGDEFEAEQAAADFLATRYLEMLEVGTAALAGAVELVADASNLPLVFHCAAGKDRTGVLAALVLSLLGVDEAVIAADYSLSGAGMKRMRAWLEATFPEAIERMAGQPQVFLAAPVEAMERFLEGVRGRYGSAETYAREIGISTAAVERLRAALLQ
jgi:protein tyrosine/serine phosphatase